MQISVEKTSDLARKMIVKVPEETVKEKMEDRFKSLAGKVKLDGFRPGKVPQHVIKKLYAKQVRGEVTSELLQTCYMKGLEDEKLQPAGPPEIIFPEQETSDTGFEFTANFEIFPSINLDNIQQLNVKRFVSEVKDDDLEKMMARLRDQQKEWLSVERASKDGDQITIHFSGEAEGENFTDGKAENFQVVIGSKQMIPGFEAELTGLEANATKTFDIEFPSDYGKDTLAGKLATFQIEVVKVEESQLPDLDETFVKKFGVESGGVDEFKKDVKNNMTREMELTLFNKTKSSVMDSLFEKIPMTLPEVMLKQELEELKKPYLESSKKGNVTVDNDMPLDAMELQAKRRVTLGLLLAEIIKNNDLKADQNKVKAMIENMAASYEKPENVINWYYANDEKLREIEQLVLENQVVDWVLGQAVVSEESLDFKDLMDTNQPA